MKICRQWTEKEVAFLVKERETRTLAEIAKILDRPYASVKNKFHHLNRKIDPKDKTNQRWDGNDVLPRIKLRKLGKDETVPPMPCCLLWHLKELAGCMEEQTIFNKRVSLEYRYNLKAIRAAA